MAERLDSIRKARNLPALGAAFIRGDGSVTSAVVGVRKRGTDVRATTEDKWPLASYTKAMTATLLATLVEQGALTWETDARRGFSGTTGGIPREVRRDHGDASSRPLRRAASEFRWDWHPAYGANACRAAAEPCEENRIASTPFGARYEDGVLQPRVRHRRRRRRAGGRQAVGSADARTGVRAARHGGMRIRWCPHQPRHRGRGRACGRRCAARLPTGGSSCSISSVASMAKARCSNPKRTRRCTSHDSVATTRSAGTSFRSHGRAASCSTTLGAPGAWIMPSCGSCRRATSRCSR